MNNSLHISTMGIIGYSLFVDLLTMGTTRDYMVDLTEQKYKMYLYSCIIIVAFVSVVKIVNLLFDEPALECDKKDKK